jgi:hypothetical protein
VQEHAGQPVHVGDQRAAGGSQLRQLLPRVPGLPDDRLHAASEGRRHHSSATTHTH